MLSDEKLKENIRPIEDADAIMKLKPVCFNMKGAKKKQYGFIAQDVEKTKLESIVFKNINGVRSVSYTQIIALLVDRVQDLTKRIEPLESQNSISEH